MPIAPPSPPYVGPAKWQGDANNKPIRRVVIHGTVSPCRAGMARIIARYFRTTSRAASAHYVVDPGETVQVVWDSVVAYHAPPNRHSVGVELCDPVVGPVTRWNDKPHKAMLARAARLTAQLCLANDIPIRKVTPAQMRAGQRGICGHDDVRDAWGQTNHWDPGAFPWARFILMVKAEAKKITADLPSPAAGGGKPKTRKPKTRVYRARLLIAQAHDLLRQAPKSRKRVHKLAADLRDVHDQLPKR